MTFNWMRHDEVCGPRPSLMIGYWGLDWGLGAILELRGHKLLRLLLGKRQVVIHFSKSTDKMTRKELDAYLVKEGIDPVALTERTTVKLAELKKRLNAESE